MYRGTTPTLYFTMPFDSTGISQLYITFNQEGKYVLEKTLGDVTYTDKRIELKLTQTDTLQIKSGAIQMQIRVKFEDDSAIASNIIYTTAKDILKGGEI